MPRKTAKDRPANSADIPTRKQGRPSLEPRESNSTTSKVLQIGVIPFGMQLNVSAMRAIEVELAGQYIDSVSTAAGNGWRLTGLTTGVDCLLQPALRQVTVTDSLSEDAAIGTAIQILETIREHLPTPQYLALTVVQTFHVRAPDDSAALSIERKLLAKTRDPLRNRSYVAGLRYYFTGEYQSTITVDPLLIDPRFFFIQYHTTQPGVFSVDALRERVLNVRATNHSLLDDMTAYLLGGTE